jgi:hypothetical protein
MAGATAVYASPVTDFEKGDITVEFGSTLNSKFEGKGEKVNGSADGKSGYKYGVVTGLGNDFALQYKGGKFKSADFTASVIIAGNPVPVTTQGKSDIQEFNLLHKINANVAAVAGWVENKISYGDSRILPATASSLQAGIMYHEKLNDYSGVFASVIGGKDVLFWEAGMSFKLAKDTEFHVSYAEREFKKVALQAPALGIASKEDYKLKGITCVVSVKLK